MTSKPEKSIGVLQYCPIGAILAGMNLEHIASELAERLGTWLDTPNDASEGLEELRSKLQALGGTIGKKAASDALRALQSSEKDIRRSRQREAADAISAALRPLGIVLVAQAPPKRQRKAAPAPKKLGSEAGAVDQVEEPSSEGSPRATEGQKPRWGREAS